MSSRGPREAPPGWHLVKTTDDLWRALGEPDGLAETDLERLLKRHHMIAYDYSSTSRMQIESYSGRMHREDLAVLQDCGFIFCTISWKTGEAFVEIEKVENIDRAIPGNIVR